MWYFTMKTATDQRPTLQMAESEEAAIAQKQSLLLQCPTGQFGDVFEETVDYANTFPHCIGSAAIADGSEELLWSDGQRTPRL